ncbi:MAG: PAS domain-containing sensor histidine kinase [Rhodobacteraceae bacterium]|nr:PAS domain-containing sensor histidine kinase [Paracoccaceae bacterium]
MLIALISIGVSFVILTGMTAIAPTQEVVWWALAVNGVLVGLLCATIIWEVAKLVQARRRGRAAARLHVRIVALFSFVAAIPALLMAILATVTLDRGLDRWFEDRTRSIIDNTLTVAQAYVQEHARVLRTDLLAMVNAVDRAKALYDFEPTRFDAFFNAQSSLRGVLASFILSSDGEVVTRVVLDPRVNILQPPKNTLQKAKGGDPILIAPGASNLVGGIMKLSAYDGFYLYVVRAMDPRVVEYQRLAEDGALEYRELEKSRFGVQIAFALVYLGVALVLLLSAIWIGFGFANGLVAPIRQLISAADDVSKGNLNVKVETEKAAGDLGNLGETFNKMTSQLLGQRDALLAANEQVDRRRRFNEAVLSGVSTGVIGIDDLGLISLVNATAERYLDKDEVTLLGRAIIDVLPELESFISEALAHSDERFQETQLELNLKGRQRMFNIRLTSEQSTRREHGYVLSLEDITDLVSAQRSSAWADVARRIAHEIKNPLTPIQLSAERIRRRYGKRIEEDREVFDQCVDTIIRQVGDIGQMVDEFSSFARMRKPSKSRNDLRNAVREAAFMQTVANPDIEIKTQLPEEELMAVFDVRLVGQAFTNVIKNAAEAVSARTGDGLAPGKITVRLSQDEEYFAVDVIDNGIGLPVENRQRLLEPYMTTREKGTGLGLAIVKKIMEDHGGGIELMDAPPDEAGHCGTQVRLTLSIHSEVTEETEDETLVTNNGA